MLLRASSWMARSAAVIVPAPAQAPRNDERLHPEDIAPEEDSDGVRQQRRHDADEDQADAGFLQSGDEAEDPRSGLDVMPMKMQSPTVSKIQIAGSGILPKNG